MKNKLKNKLKLKNTGSFFNFLMGNNKTIPVVGKGATILYWSDRDAYEVLEFNEAKKTCIIQKYNTKRIDSFGMSESQNYEYKELSGPKITLYYKWGSWKTKDSEIRFTDEVLKKFYEKDTGKFSKALHNVYKAAGGKYDGFFISTEIKGITKEYKTYHTINIIFGVKREYYDFSF